MPVDHLDQVLQPVLARGDATDLALLIGEEGIELGAELAGAGNLRGASPITRRGRGGFRLTSGDEKYICQVKPNAVVFSRLAPYENWPTFVGEALHFWDSFVDLVAPAAVERLVVRFINQIDMKSAEKASDVVHEKPLPLESVGFRSDTLFRQDLLEPDPLYRVNLVRTIQPPQPPMIPGRSLIVDIDVFTTTPTKVDRGAVDQRLREMRFLKNLVFFEFLKDPAKRFGEKGQ